MNGNIYHTICSSKSNGRKAFAVLIDPDKLDESALDKTIQLAIEAKVDFSNPINLIVCASALIIGISDISWTSGDFTFNGIINASVLAIVGYRILHSIRR